MEQSEIKKCLIVAFNWISVLNTHNAHTNAGERDQRADRIAAICNNYFDFIASNILSLRWLAARATANSAH